MWYALLNRLVLFLVAREGGGMGNRTARLGFTVLSRDKQALRRLAQVEGETMSVVLRRLIREEARRRGLLDGVQRDNLLDVETASGVGKATRDGDDPTGSPRINF